MELAYDKIFPNGTTTAATLQYNGNISSMKWSQNLGLNTVKDVAYNYAYDNLSRLSGASYLKNNGSTWSALTNNQFDETGFTYDLNGNILTLQRPSATTTKMDNLSYTYTGNQLLAGREAQRGGGRVAAALSGEKAMEHVAKERIVLAPDCGFAPGNAADIPVDEAYAKLRNMSVAARILRDKYG